MIEDCRSCQDVWRWPWEQQACPIEIELIRARTRRYSYKSRVFPFRYLTWNAVRPERQMFEFILFEPLSVICPFFFSRARIYANILECNASVRGWRRLICVIAAINGWNVYLTYIYVYLLYKHTLNDFDNTRICIGKVGICSRWSIVRMV